jgi:serine/threonine-protein kinase
MGSGDKPKSTDGVPLDLLSVIRSSGVLAERRISEIKSKIGQGEYPLDSADLAERLVQEGVITPFQARRLLSNKPQGLTVGRYIILDRLGAGSMGRVFKAHHVMMDRVVALKIIAPEIAQNDRVVARFQREMKLVGRLDHPNVVRAFDADQINKILYIVMEYVGGQSLAERLKKGPIPVAEMIDYAAQAAMGLAHAHEQGIVHRDIKPSNMLITDEKRLKILDLGLGVLMEADSAATFATADGIAVGTVDYMSPEQACGREVDGRSDLYGLGCSMYHLMTGKLPFPGATPIERLGKRISGRHVPITEHLPDISSSYVKVIDKLLAHKPHERFATAAEAADALQYLIRPRTKPSQKPSTSTTADLNVIGEIPTGKTAVMVAAAALGGGAVPAAAVREPKYPKWFVPLAELAEKRPTTALAGIFTMLAAAMGVGFVLGQVLHSAAR